MPERSRYAVGSTGGLSLFIRGQSVSGQRLTVINALVRLVSYENAVGLSGGKAFKKQRKIEALVDESFEDAAPVAVTKSGKIDVRLPTACSVNPGLLV